MEKEMSNEEILAKVREVMIDGIAEAYIRELEATNEDDLLDLYKEKVVGLVKVNGEWTHGNTLQG